MLRTYLIIKRKDAEAGEFAAGYLGTFMAHSKQVAIKKASQRWDIPREKLVAYFQPE